MCLIHFLSKHNKTNALCSIQFVFWIGIWCDYFSKKFECIASLDHVSVAQQIDTIIACRGKNVINVFLENKQTSENHSKLCKKQDFHRFTFLINRNTDENSRGYSDSDSIQNCKSMNMYRDNANIIRYNCMHMLEYILKNIILLNNLKADRQNDISYNKILLSCTQKT